MGKKRKRPHRKATPRHKYGLPRYSLGRSCHKDAVEFYYEFCVPEGWDDDDMPPSFVIRFDALCKFAEGRGRIKVLSAGATKEELRCRKQDLCAFRLCMNKAALSEAISTVIEWPFQIEVQENGRLYRVMTSEKRVADGRDADAIEGTIEAKRRKIVRLYQSIKPQHHTLTELGYFVAKSDSDDKLIADGKKSVVDTRSRIAISTTIKKLNKWKDS